MMTTYSRHVADWDGEAYGPLVSVPQVGICRRTLKVPRHAALCVLSTCACAASPGHPCSRDDVVQRRCISGGAAQDTLEHDCISLSARQRFWTCQTRQSGLAKALLLCVRFSCTTMAILLQHVDRRANTPS